MRSFLSSSSAHPASSSPEQSRWQTASDGNVILFEAHQKTEEFAPSFRGIDSLIAKLEAQDSKGMQDARKWAAATLYPEEKFTVRSLRLQMGLSQTELAKRMSSSQSHVARIERGTEDIQLSTFRKLAAALQIDLDQLNEALENQAVANTSTRNTR